MSATNRGTARNANDLYPTPAWCIRALLQHIDTQVLHGLSVLDAGAGDGRIGRAFAEHGARVRLVDIAPQSGDVRQGDYLERGWWSEEQFDLIVANPPFSLARGFIRQARSNSELTIMLSRVNLLGSRGRVEFFREHPPSKLIVLAPRPSFTGGGQDATEYAWICWGSGRALRDGLPFAWAVRDEVEVTT